jgi:thioredoxin reductase (NADPH)
MAVEEVELLNRRSKSATRLSVDLAIIRIGVVPNTELLRGKIDLDPAGYGIVNTGCETSVTGIYAIGDVASPSAPTIAGAVGTGATAAKTINACLYSARCL